MQIPSYVVSSRGSRRPIRHRVASVGLACLLLVSSGFGVGCGALFSINSTDSSAIAFATGDLRATEQSPLAEVGDACLRAIETLGYALVETIRETDELHWRATTPSGDPVEIHLKATGADQTEVRIRIGVSGDEGRSRLVLEQIRQSLEPPE